MSRVGAQLDVVACRREKNPISWRRHREAHPFETDVHLEVGATWGIHQRMITAYREPDRAKGRELMTQLIESMSVGVPAALTEVITLGRTLKKRADDVLAYFERPGTSNGPPRPSTDVSNVRRPSGSAT